MGFFRSQMFFMTGSKILPSSIFIDVFSMAELRSLGFLGEVRFGVKNPSSGGSIRSWVLGGVAHFARTSSSSIRSLMTSRLAISRPASIL